MFEKINQTIENINQYIGLSFKLSLLETELSVRSLTTNIDNIKYQLNIRSNNNNIEEFKQLLRKFNNFLLDIEVNKKFFYRFRKIDNYNSSSC